jgi:hypothetical protein
MTEIGRCRDCRWWDASDLGRSNPRARTACLKVEQRETGAFTIDKITAVYVGDHVALLTTPDFGCVQFEAEV